MSPTAIPPVPVRNRQNRRRESVPGPSVHARTNDTNRVNIQPASPEVISSLITSLSIISSPANQLFEQSDVPLPSPKFLSKTSKPLSAADRHMFSHGADSGGSFGIDYGAFNQPSLQETPEEGPLDELAASPPVIRTAKPPSGYSSLTAPRSPTKDGSSLKLFLRGNSRPSSKDSSASKDRDEVGSIGNVSIEPSTAPPHELKRQSSTDSWGKKQSRNQKGLMYMSSKERLRETERKRTSAGLIGSAPKGLGIDRLSLPVLDSDSFMAETPINEEAAGEPGNPSPSRTNSASAAPSPSIGAVSPALSSSSQGGIGFGRYVPARDSSLRQPSTTKRRSTHRSSRQGGKQREGEDDEETIKEVDEQQFPRQERRNEKKTGNRLDVHSDIVSKLQKPLVSPVTQKPLSTTTLASEQVVENAKVERRRVVEDPKEEGAPSPAVAQRKARSGEYSQDFQTKIKKTGRRTPELLEQLTRKDNQKVKRLSAPLSPTGTEKEHHQRSASQPLTRKSMTSPEPKPQINVDDRPTSADSVDDAVDAYLCSPRLSQKIRHPQTGRTISFSEVGDSEGFAVFCCVGMGLTRYITAFYDELALTLKLRLITPDRPGVGDSESYSDGTATPLSWPDDVYAICQTLKITKFSILAHSAGAIYALATALRMPQHIRGRIHLLAPWIPPSQMNVFGAQKIAPPGNSLPTSQRILRALPTPILKAANSSFMSATSTSITSSLPKSPRRTKRKSTPVRETTAPGGRRALTPGPGDKENQGPNSSVYPKPADPSSALERAVLDITDPNSEAAILAAAAHSLADKERQMTYDTRLTHAIWELATSGANPAVDLLVCLERRHTIGFRYVDITRAVVIHHGSKDTRVPVENVKWLGKMMKRCEVRILEGEGHGLMASAGVMGSVLMDISREWEDWMRLVDQKGVLDGGRSRALRERASVGAFR